MPHERDLLCQRMLRRLDIGKRQRFNPALAACAVVELQLIRIQGIHEIWSEHEAPFCLAQTGPTSGSLAETSGA